MRRRLFATLAVGASLGALVSAAASPQRGLALPAGPDVRSKEAAPLLGLRWSERERRQELVHVDPVSLQAQPEPSLGVGRYGSSWAFSPDRERLAYAAHSDSRRGIVSSLQVVEPRNLRRELALPLGFGEIWALAWLAPDRLLAVRHGYHPERLEVVTVAPSARRVIARAELNGQLIATGRSNDALVLLLSPQGRIGPGTLAVASASGEVRSVPLERIWLGTEVSQDDGDYVATWRRPGFAVDPAGRALVFPAGSDAAEVDLRTLAVTYHSLAEPVSLFGRLRRFLDPAATAKAMDGPWRSARWLGNGLVALTGTDHATWKDRESRTQARSTPAGLTIVDTHTWRARTVDRGASSAYPAEGLVLATGGACDSETRVCTSMGLAAYDVGGNRRFRLFEDRAVFVSQVFRGLAYVGEEREQVRVVELAPGRIVATRRDAPPQLLLDDVSPFDG